MVGALAGLAGPAFAEDINISVWAGGSNDSDSYRIEAIEIAADLLEREAAILGEELNITVEGRRDFTGWDEFKQGITLGAEAGTAPEHRRDVASGHRALESGRIHRACRRLR